ncbi:DUF6602 domain-containing protein [Pseudomonas oryzihabitans]|uniref:DUF6602 domain-containing protein n=1 Tax=Pseudomonas oryzihabitans TaxID=47885 RepID=UPI001122FE27|nr:DUF6602 domain-containing protein [Pseudomonas psychrotolerans]
MKPLVEYCRGAVGSIIAQYEMTKVLGHSATMGSTREKLIQDFLIAHLPQMTNAVSGVVVDSNGARSKQQDIVLVLKSMPRLPFASGHDLILQEGVVATLEIKTEISPSLLEDICTNIRSVKDLKPSSLAGAQLGDVTWPYARILTVVITYGGSSLGSIWRKLDSFPDVSIPDVYLDFTKGVLIRNEGLIYPVRGTDSYLFFEDPSIGLARLLTILSKVTGCLLMRDVNWDEYVD